MRSFCLSLVAIGILLLPACSFQASDSNASVPPVEPKPIDDSTPPERASETAQHEIVEDLQPADVASTAESRFTLDPAPAPPEDSASSSNRELADPKASAGEAFQSVARVLRGAIVGGTEDSETESRSSLFGSVGRALSKGLQEAVAGADQEDAGDEDGSTE